MRKASPEELIERARAGQLDSDGREARVDHGVHLRPPRLGHAADTGEDELRVDIRQQVIHLSHRSMWYLDVG